MDSATSGSLQSSSGGGGVGDYDDFTSPRPPIDSLSSFLNLPPPPSPQPHPPSTTTTTTFDSLSSFFPQSPPSFPLPWPPRSLPLPPNPPPDPPPPPPPSSSASPSGGRGTKKRSRTSRRAPTTVLTTDTSNFRAMVQEFTGFPAPPFATPARHLPRPRLDLSSAPPYLLRPFAHKFGPATAPPLAINSAARNIASSASTSAYSAPSNLLNIQNPPLQPTFGISRPPPPLDFGELGSLIPCVRRNDGMPSWPENRPGQPDKAPERGDGAVDSWIVTSD